MQSQLSKSTLADFPVRISWKLLPFLTDIGALSRGKEQDILWHAHHACQVPKPLPLQVQIARPAMMHLYGGL